MRVEKVLVGVLLLAIGVLLAWHTSWFVAHYNNSPAKLPTYEWIAFGFLVVVSLRLLRPSGQP